MQKKGGEGVQIACENAYIINGRPIRDWSHWGVGVTQWEGGGACEVLAP